MPAIIQDEARMSPVRNDKNISIDRKYKLNPKYFILKYNQFMLLPALKSFGASSLFSE